MSDGTNNKIINISSFQQAREEMSIPSSIQKASFKHLDKNEIAKDMQLGYMKLLSNQK